MDLFNQIVAVYPELEPKDFDVRGSIELRDDGDGIQYIAKWDYSQPIPTGLTVGKPGGN